MQKKSHRGWALKRGPWPKSSYINKFMEDYTSITFLMKQCNYTTGRIYNNNKEYLVVDMLWSSRCQKNISILYESFIHPYEKSNQWHLWPLSLFLLNLFKCIKLSQGIEVYPVIYIKICLSYMASE